MMMMEREVSDVRRPGANGAHGAQQQRVLQLDPATVRPTRDWRHSVDDDDEWARFRTTIQVFGVLEPILVGRDAEGYFVRTGHRRHRACAELGQVVPSLLTEVDADVKVALVENIHRKNLRPAELAEALTECKKSYPNAAELARDIGLSESHVSNLLRIKRKAHPELWELFKARHGGIDWMVLAEICKLPLAEQLAAWNESQGRGGGKQRRAGGRPSVKLLKAAIDEHAEKKGPFWDGYREALSFALGAKKKKSERSSVAAARKMGKPGAAKKSAASKRKRPRS